MINQTATIAITCLGAVFAITLVLVVNPATSWFRTMISTNKQLTYVD
jgi:spore coat protein U-like protein